MTLKSYLWGMRVSTFFALFGWIFVINYIDPEKSGILGEMIFYATTFILSFGVFTLFLTRLRKKTVERGEVGIGTNFRQGMLLSVLIIILLVLQRMRILIWWDGLLVAAGIFLIELYFLSHKD